MREQCREEIVVNELHHHAESDGGATDITPHGAADRTENDVGQFIWADRETLHGIAKGASSKTIEEWSDGSTGCKYACMQRSMEWDNPDGRDIGAIDLEKVQEVDLLLVVIEASGHGGGVDYTDIDAMVLDLCGQRGSKGGDEGFGGGVQDCERGGHHGSRAGGVHDAAPQLLLHLERTQPSPA